MTSFGRYHTSDIALFIPFEHDSHSLCNFFYTNLPTSCYVIYVCLYSQTFVYPRTRRKFRCSRSPFIHTELQQPHPHAESSRPRDQSNDIRRRCRRNHRPGRFSASLDVSHRLRMLKFSLAKRYIMLHH